MIEVFFFMTESMSSKPNLFDGFNARVRGKNVCVVIADDDSVKLAHLIDLVEGFGCAIQIDSDVTSSDDELLMKILREYNCV